MKVIQLSYPCPESIIDELPANGQTMAIGDFDGVHLGHREVIGRAVNEAKRLSIPSAVMTFHPHPREVLGSAENLSYLTTLDEKIEKFGELGVDAVYVFRFDPAFAALSPDEFANHVLKVLKVKCVVVGFNFHFGRQGSGNAEMLRELGEGDFDVAIVDPFIIGGERVSSTSIREAIKRGDLDRANAMLGRPFETVGTVVPGDGRGRTIGIPTANLSVDERAVVPAMGVYAVTVRIESGSSEGEVFRGVMNVGLKPTFHSDLPKPTWEVHLLNFNGDLYGARLRVAFHSRLRSERKFPSVEALIDQIHADIREADQRLS